MDSISTARPKNARFQYLRQAGAAKRKSKNSTMPWYTIVRYFMTAAGAPRHWKCVWPCSSRQRNAKKFFCHTRCRARNNKTVQGSRFKVQDRMEEEFKHADR